MNKMIPVRCFFQISLLQSMKLKLGNLQAIKSMVYLMCMFGKPGKSPVIPFFKKFWFVDLLRDRCSLLTK